MKKTILVVDDQGDIRTFLKKTLSRHNFNVVEAGDGEVALKLVEEVKPDLVVLDFGLPKVSGETVCVEIKKNHPEIIVIALTSKSSSEDVVHGLHIGADDYMTKPFVPEELMARIQARFKSAPDSIDEVSSTIVPEEQDHPFQKLKIRESVVLIAIRLIGIQVLFGLLFYSISLAISYADSSLNVATTNILPVYATSSLAFFVFNAIITLMVVLRWYFKYSEITRDHIVNYSGILHKTQEKNACNYMETITVDQSFLGMLLGYGTLMLYDPALKEPIYLVNIANPKGYASIIGKSFLKNRKAVPPFAATTDTLS